MGRLLVNVHPESVAQRALEAADEFPHKRLLVHFNQPHGPYLGPTGQELVIGPGNTPVRDRSFFEDAKIRLTSEMIYRDVWRDAYGENFEIVEPYVDTLLARLDGLSVVTADHGEMPGERAWPFPFRHYNHQIGYHHEKLTTVPWLVHDDGSLRTIEAGDPHGDKIDTPTSVSSRLEDLGYVL